MRDVIASVGMAHSGQCENRVEDQQTVMDLLDQILPALGGTAGIDLDWLEPTESVCAEDLHQAILYFQQTNVQEIRHIDGHVDPGQATIRCLNRLAETTIGSVEISEIHFPEDVAPPGRFVTAPDGTNIPLPVGAFRGGRSLVQDDATIDVWGDHTSGYTILIDNVHSSADLNT